MLKLSKDSMNIPGNILVELMNNLLEYVKPGMTTDEINSNCHQFIISKGATAGALNYKNSPNSIPFPRAICSSVNAIVCHGIPNDIPLKNGDIVSFDVVIKKNDHFSDSCITMAIGSISPREQKLIEVAHDTMWNAINIIKEGTMIRELGRIMQNTAESYGFNVIRDFCGHGIGQIMHGDPQIPFYYCKELPDFMLVEGMCITIEPMVTMGTPNLKILQDGWSAQMCDRSKTAQFEHTIYIHKNGYDVLTFNNYDTMRKKIKTNC